MTNHCRKVPHNLANISPAASPWIRKKTKPQLSLRDYNCSQILLGSAVSCQFMGFNCCFPFLCCAVRCGVLCCMLLSEPDTVNDIWPAAEPILPKSQCFWPGQKIDGVMQCKTLLFSEREGEWESDLIGNAHRCSKSFCGQARKYQNWTPLNPSESRTFPTAISISQGETKTPPR